MTDPRIATPQAGAPRPPPTRGLSSLVSSLARAIDRELPEGDVASLRRLDPEDPSCAGFWKLMTGWIDREGELSTEGPRRLDIERRWAVILSALARLRGLHQPSKRLGHALADVGFSELRFVRLLRARDEALHDAVRRAAGYLAAKGQNVDATDLARLVLTTDSTKAELVRRQIARDYYAHAKNT